MLCNLLNNKLYPNCMLTVKLSWLRQELCMGANYEVCTRHMGWHFLVCATWKKAVQRLCTQNVWQRTRVRCKPDRILSSSKQHLCVLQHNRTNLCAINHIFIVGGSCAIPKSIEMLTRGNVQTSFANMQLWEMPLPKMQFKLRWASAIDQRGHHIRLHLFDKYAGLVP